MHGPGAREYFGDPLIVQVGRKMELTPLAESLLIPRLAVGTARIATMQPRSLYQAMAGYGGIVPEIRETVMTTNSHTVNYRPLEVLLQPAPWHRGRVVFMRRTPRHPCWGRSRWGRGRRSSTRG